MSSVSNIPAPVNAAPPRPAPLTARRLGGGNKELGLFALLVAVCAVVSVLNHRFYSPENLGNVARLVGLFGLFSLGLGAVIITGGIDLSVGSVLALEGVLLSFALTEWGWPPLLVVIAAIGLTSALGLLHGLLITRVPLQPFIVTLCGLLFYRGMARYVSNDETKGFGDAKGFEGLQTLATGSVGGVPMPFVLLVLASVAMWILLHRSVWGRHLFAIGRNEEAARYSGINTRAVLTTAYVLCGALAGVAGILIAFYTNSVSPSSHGNFYELYGIAAGGPGRVQSARRRRLGGRYRDRRNPAPGPPKPGEPPRYPLLPELSRNGNRDPPRCDRRRTLQTPRRPPGVTRCVCLAIASTQRETKSLLPRGTPSRRGRRQPNVGSVVLRNERSRVFPVTTGKTRDLSFRNTRSSVWLVPPGRGCRAAGAI